jgi:hypothetical protein
MAEHRLGDLQGAVGDRVLDVQYRLNGPALQRVGRGGDGRQRQPDLLLLRARVAASCAASCASRRPWAQPAANPAASTSART